MSEAKTAGGYIWRIKELEQENLELKAHVERLRGSAKLYAWADSDTPPGYVNVSEKDIDSLDAVLAEVPSKSFADHDREVAERVREVLLEMFNGWPDSYIPAAIRNLDLDEVLKDG